MQTGKLVEYGLYSCLFISMHIKCKYLYLSLHFTFHHTLINLGSHLKVLKIFSQNVIIISVEYRLKTGCIRVHELSIGGPDFNFPDTC